jgi:hypothetical protein
MFVFYILWWDMFASNILIFFTIVVSARTTEK